VRSHEYPKPMWKEDGSIDYAPNRQGVERMKKEGWREECVKLKFPMALHAAGNQGITVYNEDELQRALKNGWSMKPAIEDDPVTMPASPDRAPLRLDDPVLPVSAIPSAKRGKVAVA